jgi:hypothetical protein
MDNRQANLVVAKLHELGYEEAHVYANYSGRGMHGKTTCGIVGSDMLRVGIAIGCVISDSDYEEEFLDCPDGGLPWREDALGKSTIVY